MAVVKARARRDGNAVDLVFSADCVFHDQPQADRRLVSGIPEQIAADLRQYQDPGVLRFIFIFSFPADSAARQQEAMERFSREVMPLIPND